MGGCCGVILLCEPKWWDWWFLIELLNLAICNYIFTYPILGCHYLWMEFPCISSLSIKYAMMSVGCVSVCMFPSISKEIIFYLTFYYNKVIKKTSNYWIYACYIFFLLQVCYVQMSYGWLNLGFIFWIFLLNMILSSLMPFSFSCIVWLKYFSDLDWVTILKSFLNILVSYHLGHYLMGVINWSWCHKLEHTTLSLVFWTWWMCQPSGPCNVLPSLITSLRIKMNIC